MQTVVSKSRVIKIESEREQLNQQLHQVPQGNPMADSVHLPKLGLATAARPDISIARLRPATFHRIPGHNRTAALHGLALKGFEANKNARDKRVELDTGRSSCYVVLRSSRRAGFQCELQPQWRRGTPSGTFCLPRVASQQDILVG